MPEEETMFEALLRRFRHQLDVAREWQRVGKGDRVPWDDIDSTLGELLQVWPKDESEPSSLNRLFVTPFVAHPDYGRRKVES